MKVLSLFDGISCGMVALDRAGIPVERYVAYEIEKNAIKISKKNYPQIEHCGDVTTADFTQYEGFDLLIGGSPCQSLSIVQSKTRQHLEGKSKLFFEFVRALEDAKPRYFLFENVASMNEQSKQTISELLGCHPVLIDSRDFSAQERPRYYWTNISIKNQKHECLKVLKDIMLPAEQVHEKYWYNFQIENIDMSKQVCGTLIHSNYEMHRRIFNPDFKCHTLTCVSGGNQQKKVLQNGRARKLTPVEYERLQTLPDNYTQGISDGARYNAIGNGWTVDVIAHILSYIKNEKEIDKMELKIFSPSEEGFVKEIAWNHEEIKKEVAEKVAFYKGLVYTDDQIKDAKADKAKLNKFVQALETKRKEVKKLCLAPYEDFEKKMKEIVSIVNEPILLIDSQVKGYEDKKKQEKLDQIKSAWCEKTKPDWLKFEQVYSQKWLNASVSMKSIISEMKEKIEQVEKDLATLSSLPEFGFEAAEVYKTTLDVNRAVNEAHRMSEVAKAKAAHEEEMKKMAEEQARLREEASQASIEKPEPAAEPEHEPVADEKQWVSFRACLTFKQAVELRAFFESRNIQFESI